MSKTAYTDGTFQGEDRAAQLYSDIDLFFGLKLDQKIYLNLLTLQQSRGL
jgi:hypothetical protein